MGFAEPIRCRWKRFSILTGRESTVDHYGLRNHGCQDIAHRLDR